MYVCDLQQETLWYVECGISWDPKSHKIGFMICGFSVIVKLFVAGMKYWNFIGYHVLLKDNSKLCTLIFSIFYNFTEWPFLFFLLSSQQPIEERKWPAKRTCFLKEHADYCFSPNIQVARMCACVSCSCSIGFNKSRTWHSMNLSVLSTKTVMKVDGP